MPFNNLDEKREYQRLWIKKRRQDFFKDKSCVSCGSKERLELDHIDRTTKISNSIWSWSKLRRQAEILKCQILCHECHKIKTTIEFAKPIIHGTKDGYSSHRCRCYFCTEAQRIYQSMWLKKQKELN